MPRTEGLLILVKRGGAWDVAAVGESGPPGVDDDGTKLAVAAARAADVGLSEAAKSCFINIMPNLSAAMSR